MKKAATIVAPGFEEGETLTIVDIIRRANITCDLIGLKEVVEGGHGIIIRCDKVLNHALVEYDMVILPGGYGGADKMKNSETLISFLKEMDEKGKYICAMCAAPIVLEKAKVISGKKVTGYTGYQDKLVSGDF